MITTTCKNHFNIKVIYCNRWFFRWLKLEGRSEYADWCRVHISWWIQSGAFCAPNFNRSDWAVSLSNWKGTYNEFRISCLYIPTLAVRKRCMFSNCVWRGCTRHADCKYIGVKKCCLVWSDLDVVSSAIYWVSVNWNISCCCYWKPARSWYWICCAILIHKCKCKRTKCALACACIGWTCQDSCSTSCHYSWNILIKGSTYCCRTYVVLTQNWFNLHLKGIWKFGCRSDFICEALNAVLSY